MLSLLFVTLVLVGSVSASRRWDEDGSWEDEEEPSAGFWVVVGVAGAVALVLIVMIIWYFCCQTQTAITGTPAGGIYSAVLHNVQGNASGVAVGPGAVFTPAGVPLQSTKRE
jgi:hypothetical protein